MYGHQPGSLMLLLLACVNINQDLLYPIHTASVKLRNLKCGHWVY